MKKQDGLIKELIKYCKDILKDKPLSCVKHKWACERFLRDLKREGTKEFPYVFKPEKAKRFFTWCGYFKHTKGILKGQNIKLDIILKFIFGNIYGWYHKDTGYRRFDKLYWQVARKNAKSQMLSLVASYELMAFDETGEEINEIYCAATKAEQAKIVYDETKIMMSRCDIIQGYYNTKGYRITHNKSDSFIRVLTKEDRKKGDGLNPKVGIVDEVHAHETTEVVDVLYDGMAARENPLLAMITTAGSDLNVPCYRVEYKLITKILDPNIDLEMENYFIMVNELDKDENGELIDNIKDPKVWVKANPIVCSYPLGIERTKKALKEALEEPEKMRNFLTKRMNIWVHLTELAYMKSERWAKCKKKLPKLKKQSVYIGIDFATKVDLSSVAFELPIKDKYIVLSHSFIAEETLYQKMKTDKVPYDLWQKQGWITVMPGPIVDYRKAIDYINEKIEEYDWYAEEWCFDPHSASQIMSWVIEDGEKATAIRQGQLTLSEPTKDFRDMVLAERVIHDGNPVLAWAISNAIAEEVDRNQNILLSKKKSPQRIDPIAAVINAHTRAMHSDVNSEPQIFIV